MKKVIVSTTINPPTEAICRFDFMLDWDLVVIGDLKTPKDYALKRGAYYSTRSAGEVRQGTLGRYWLELHPAAELRPPGRPRYGSRRGRGGRRRQHSLSRLGREPSCRQGCRGQFLRDRSAGLRPDGRHQPFRSFGTAAFRYSSSPSATTAARRATLFMSTSKPISGTATQTSTRSAAWSTRRNAMFDPAYFPIASNKLSPFNSQNTFIAGCGAQGLFPLSPLSGVWMTSGPPTTFRPRAIASSSAKASVFQDRNVHDPVRDMKQEYLGYENNLDHRAGPRARILNQSRLIRPAARTLGLSSFIKRHFKHA